MTKPRSVVLIGITVFGVIVVAAFAAHVLFNGVFDKGTYEIQEVQPFSATQVAIVAKTSDGQALDGDVYFVLIEDHQFSTKELRRDYYRRRAVFATNRDCLTLKWINSSALQVSCSGDPVSRGQIDVQKDQSDGIAISYLNIAAD